jgi:hypothetical protein
MFIIPPCVVYRFNSANPDRFHSTPFCGCHWLCTIEYSRLRVHTAADTNGPVFKNRRFQIHLGFFEDVQSRKQMQNLIKRRPLKLSSLGTNRWTLLQIVTYFDQVTVEMVATNRNPKSSNTHAMLGTRIRRIRNRYFLSVYTRQQWPEHFKNFPFVCQRTTQLCRAYRKSNRLWTY